MSSTYDIVVPGSADQLRTLRMFVAAVARDAGMDDERIADLKIAVSEIATAAIAAGSATVEVSVDRSEGALSLSLPEPPPGDTDPFDPVEMVTALLGVPVEPRQGRLVITLSISGASVDG